MKIKNIMKIVAGSLIMIALSVNVSVAASWCSSAVIKEVSLLPDLANEFTSMYAIKLDCEDASWDEAEAGGPIQFLIVSDLGISGYTSALTALASNKKIGVQTQATSWNSLLTRIRIINE